MNNKELSKFVSEMINDLMKKNEDVIVESLIRGVEDADPIGAATMRIIVNAIRLSANLSVQCVLAGLEEAGYIELRDRPLPNIRVLDPEE